MIHFSSLKKAILISACLFSNLVLAQSVPTEQKITQIKRMAQSDSTINGNLSKNLFKSETYQAPYIVQVPYQAEETYTIEVPYQITETYVETVPYTVRVPYTEYVTDYRQEYKCNNVTRYREECSNQQKCYLVPGGGQQCRMVEECGVNVHGQRICKTRQVCTDSGSSQRCDTQRVCQNVPYNDRVCNYEQVPYQREVTSYRDETSYRQETRTRTVTKYRTETRTRTVTKYREEQKCCETKTREVYDRQLQYQVQVNFPQDAILTANQSEILNVILISANENTALVELQIINSIYGYQIVNQSVSGAVITVELATVPKLDLRAGTQDLAGLADAKNLNINLVGANLESALTLNDASLQFSDISTEYQIYLDLLTANGSKPLNTKTFSREQVMASGGIVKMKDVIGYDTVVKNSLKAGHTITFTVIAKRFGNSSVLGARVIKVQKTGSVFLN